MLPTGERYAHLHLERGHKDSGLYVIPKDGSVRPRLAYCRPRNHTVAERIRAFELRAWSPRATHAQVDASLVGIFHGRPIYEPPTIASLFSQLAVSANKYLSLSLSLSPSLDLPSSSCCSPPQEPIDSPLYGPWLLLLQDRGLPPFSSVKPLLTCNIGALCRGGIVEKYQNVPELAVIVQSLLPPRHKLNISCTLADPTGSIGCTFDHDDFKDELRRRQLAVGTVILLKNARLYVPNGFQIYLLISKGSIDRLYPPYAPAPPMPALFSAPSGSPLPAIYASRKDMREFFQAQPKYAWMEPIRVWRAAQAAKLAPRLPPPAARAASPPPPPAPAAAASPPPSPLKRTRRQAPAPAPAPAAKPCAGFDRQCSSEVPQVEPVAPQPVEPVAALEQVPSIEPVQPPQPPPAEAWDEIDEMLANGGLDIEAKPAEERDQSEERDEIDELLANGGLDVEVTPTEERDEIDELLANGGLDVEVTPTEERDEIDELLANGGLDAQEYQLAPTAMEDEIDRMIAEGGAPDS